MADDKHGSMKIDAALVRELAQLLADTDLTEIEVEDSDRRIRVARQITATPVQQTLAYAPAPPTTAAPAAIAADPAASGGPSTALDAPALNAVKSPMVGTVYLQPEPTAGVFKAIGDSVKEGETILIIEAMKVMNAIPAPRGGTLSAMLVTTGQPVEFDQPLFVID